MDMSVKLNLSYPATQKAEQVAQSPVARSTEASKTDDAHKDTQTVHDAAKVKSAVSEIEKFLKASQRNLEFSTDEESGNIVFRVIASDSCELIRQLPSEEALRIAHSLSDVNSVLFDAKV